MEVVSLGEGEHGMQCPFAHILSGCTCHSQDISDDVSLRHLLEVAPASVPHCVVLILAFHIPIFQKESLKSTFKGEGMEVSLLGGSKIYT